jgi:hypothetical protein
MIFVKGDEAMDNEKSRNWKNLLELFTGHSFAAAKHLFKVHESGGKDRKDCSETKDY